MLLTFSSGVGDCDICKKSIQLKENICAKVFDSLPHFLIPITPEVG